MSSQWFQNIIDSIADKGRELLGLDNSTTQQGNIIALCRQLLAGRGEASGVALSQEILRVYRAMSAEARRDFFAALAQEFEPDLEQMQQAMHKYESERSAENLIALNKAVEAPRQELFRRLNFAPQGTAHLVAMRAELLDAIKENPQFKSVDADLKHLLSSWFNRGFLQLRSIDWRSPAHILEKLINYESVHEIQGWDDLRRRLMQDRRCFAFFHHAMPDEPLIFIEVALVQGLSNSIKSLIDPATPVLDTAQADSAIFYSINNTQAGLRGISFGNFLIKQVLTELTTDCPWLKVSSTLSPIPSFAGAIQKWIRDNKSSAINTSFDSVLARHADVLMLAESQGDGEINPKTTFASLLSVLLADGLDTMQAELSPVLHDLALAYLTRTNRLGKLPDPVAMFHLSNGARLERINVFADTSEQGMANSYGVMVNYLYDLKDVERNHEVFVTRGKIMMSDLLWKQVRQTDKDN